MDKNYISRRKLIKTLKYITNKKFKITVIDDHDCSFSGMRYTNKCTGIIKKFSINTYEDAEIKLIIDFTDNITMEVWLDNMYYLEHFDLNDYIEYDTDNGDGTYSYFKIIMEK